MAGAGVSGYFLTEKVYRHRVEVIDQLIEVVPEDLAAQPFVKSWKLASGLRTLTLTHHTTYGRQQTYGPAGFPMDRPVAEYTAEEESNLDATNHPNRVVDEYGKLTYLGQLYYAALRLDINIDTGSFDLYINIFGNNPWTSCGQDLTAENIPPFSAYIMLLDTDDTLAQWSAWDIFDAASHWRFLDTGWDWPVRVPIWVWADPTVVDAWPPNISPADIQHQ
jgi:hypothetical protein